MSKQRMYRGKTLDGVWVYGWYCEVEGKHVIIPCFKGGKSDFHPFIGTTNGIQGYMIITASSVQFNVGDFWFDVDLFETMAMQSREYKKALDT